MVCPAWNKYPGLTSMAMRKAEEEEEDADAKDDDATPPPPPPSSVLGSLGVVAMDLNLG